MCESAVRPDMESAVRVGVAHLHSRACEALLHLVALRRGGMVVSHGAVDG